MLALVGASVAVPVALAKAQENKVLDQVIVLEADEAEQLYVTRSMPFTEQTEIYAAASLDAKIARDAYPAEISEQDALDSADTLARAMMAQMREQWVALFNPNALSMDEAMQYAKVTAALYESPSGTTKVAYWQVTYEWSESTDGKLFPESWPLYYLEISCDTMEGRPYSMVYRFYPFIGFPDDCGVQAFSEALGEQALLDTAERISTGISVSSSAAAEIGEDVLNAEMWQGKSLIFYLLSDSELCVVKTVNYHGEDGGRIQVISERLVEKIK